MPIQKLLIAINRNEFLEEFCSPTLLTGTIVREETTSKSFQLVVLYNFFEDQWDVDYNLPAIAIGS